MNKVRFMGYAFMNDDIVNFPTAYTHQALISSELNADEIELQLRFNPDYLGYYIDDASAGSDYLRAQHSIYAVKSGNGVFPFTEYDNATPLDLYQDETLLARYYITSIAPSYKKDGYIYFSVSAISFIGLTINMAHNGGLYTSTQIGVIIADILKATKDNTRSTSTLFYFNMSNGLYYTMDSLVYNYRVSGRLPATDGENVTARDNIRDVLFASGASILKNADGSLYFTFNQPSEATLIEDEQIYTGQPYSEDDIVTTVKVISHAYFAIEGGEEKTLFDSSGDVVDHAKILFNEPVFRFSDTTLTINESGVNYAIVSGTGVLKGYEYTHTRQEFSKTIANGIENIKTSSSSLVSTLNYLSVLERMENYYKNALQLKTSFVVPSNVKAGSLIRFTDMFNNTKNGFIKDMDVSYSGIDKGTANVVVNWIPSNVGEGFTKCYLLQGNTTWSKATAEADVGHAITKARVVLLGGGHGGYNGENGGVPNGTGRGATSGRGGNGGNGGEGGKVNAVTLESNVPSSISVSCGVGGEPGAEGGATTATINGTTYSSANGSVPTGGVMNLISGDVYATVGDVGIRGGHGGNEYDQGSGTFFGEPTVYVDANGVEHRWEGGRYADSRTVEVYKANSYGGYSYDHTASTDITCGSGSAYGANGNASSQGGLYNYTYENGKVVAVGLVMCGASANGADAQPCTDYVPNIAGGGRGGNGGGGVGLQGRPSGGTQNNYGTVGRGGYGSVGTKGGNGAVLIYV